MEHCRNCSCIKYVDGLDQKDKSIQRHFDCGMVMRISEDGSKINEEIPCFVDNTYGLCPVCGARGKKRERRPNGNDTCVNGHKYPSASAAKIESPEEWANRYAEPRVKIQFDDTKLIMFKEGKWLKQHCRLSQDAYARCGLTCPLCTVVGDRLYLCHGVQLRVEISNEPKQA